jgi:O-methyltransferase
MTIARLRAGVAWRVRKAREVVRLVAVRPVELLHPAVLWRGRRLSNELRAKDLTMIGPYRARTLYRLARSVERRGVAGAIVDCGVRNGGSTMLLSEGAPSREVWAFDSFEGMPAPTAMDEGGWMYEEGALRGSVETLRRGFETYGDPERLRVVEGWFADTLPAAVPEIDRIAILHVDADFYEPVKLALETFYPKLSRGGYVIVDDYFAFIGARRATDELRSRYGITRPLGRDHYWRR